MRNKSIREKDIRTYPVEDVRKILRDFGDKHGFKSSTVIGKALDIPVGTIDSILYSTSVKGVFRSTKELIESKIRNYDPSVCPEKIIKKEAFSKVLDQFRTEYDLSYAAMSRILDLPQSTLKNWMGPKRGLDFRAKEVRPILVKMQEYRAQRGRSIAKAVSEYRSNAGIS